MWAAKIENAMSLLREIKDALHEIRDLLRERNHA